MALYIDFGDAGADRPITHAQLMFDSGLEGFERRVSSAASSEAENKALMASHLAERQRLEDAETRILALETQNAELLERNERLESLVSQLTNDLIEERQCQEEKDRAMREVIQQKNELIGQVQAATAT